MFYTEGEPCVPIAFDDMSYFFLNVCREIHSYVWFVFTRSSKLDIAVTACVNLIHAGVFAHPQYGVFNAGDMG